MDWFIKPLTRIVQMYSQSRLMRAAIGFLATILLIVLTHRLVPDPYNIVTDLVIAAFGLFAVLQTDAITADLRAYVTHELIKKPVTSLSIEEIQAPFGEVSSGLNYTISFKFRYRRPIASTKVTHLSTRLSMIPPIYLGQESLESVSRWKTEGEFEFREYEGLIAHSLSFDTNKINPDCPDVRKLNPKVNLVIELEEELGGKCELTVGPFEVRLRSANELFRGLIRRNLIKKIPAGYDEIPGIPIGISPSDPSKKFYTNIHFLARRLDLSEERRAFEDDFNELEFDIARFLTEICNQIVEREPRQYSLKKYSPIEEYEADLVTEQLLDRTFQKIKSAIRPDLLRAEGMGGGGTILVTLFQTEDFTKLLEAQSPRNIGVTLFGFSGIAKRNTRIEMVFDLQNLSVDDSATPCSVNEKELCLITLLAKSEFKEYSLALHERLSQPAAEQPLCASSVQQEAYGEPETLYDKLADLRKYVNRSIETGIFVTSEPKVSQYWFVQEIFERELRENGRLDMFQATVSQMIERCVQRGYNLDMNATIVVNLCAPGTDISSELPALYDFKHDKVEVVDVSFTDGHPKIPEALSENDSIEWIVILSALDSYVSALNELISQLEKHHKTTVAIIPVFSIARAEAYEQAENALRLIDNIPLFSIDFNTGKAVHILQREDYRTLRPWLCDT
jgi:hypothetical protein